MSKIHILADSSADLTLEEAEKYDIRLMPIRLSFSDGSEFRAEEEVKADEFYKRLRETGDVPKTVQITPAEFEEIFRDEAKNGYDEIVVVTIASTASGTYQSAALAKQAVEDEGVIKVHLVDSMHLAFGIGYAVICGAHLLQKGADASAVAARISEILSKTQTYFAVETLDYLKKGGRIKTTTAIIGGMLDIRPILHVKDGVVYAYDKVRGEKKVNPKFLSILKEQAPDLDNTTVMVLSGDAGEHAENLIQSIETELGKKVDIKHVVGPIIGSHAGPGVLGLCFVGEKSEL